MRTKNQTLLTLSTMLRLAASNVALELTSDDGDGVCVSDLQAALHELRSVIREVEVVAGDVMEE